MNSPYHTHSGDPAADRRADYAEMLSREGDHGAAAEVMAGALELAPGWALGWFRLGEFHESGGDIRAAAEAWRVARRLDPVDHAGAALKLALSGQEDAGGTMPAAFVETLFDQYAEKFDASLLGQLGYRAPELLFDAIMATDQGSFACAVDLGCGTGLMGERLRPVCHRLEGYDISAGMLAKARAKGVYDLLVKADIQDMPPMDGLADLVVAADVFMYVGALQGIFARVAAMLRPGGLFAFSVERHAGEEPVKLRESRRYAHSDADVVAGLAAAGFILVSLAPATIRQDRTEPIEGLIVVAERRP